MTNHELPIFSVLLIDDEALALELISHSLSGCGDLRLTYEGGAENAVAAVLAAEPAVILVDLRMPTMDGFEVIRRLREHPASAQVPVILLSSEEDAEIKARAFASGANDYLVKWPDPRELAARLRYHGAAYLARCERDAAFVSLRQSQKELAESQAALLQAQKMEAIGQLTGGVAHDFNNVLQIIGGNLELLKLSGGLGEAALARVKSAQGGVERGARLASHLLAFGRRQPLQSVVINPGLLLRHMDEMLRRVLGARADLVTEIAPDLWSTLVDPSQLNSMMLNLAINARDAMSEGGTLTVRALNVLAGAGAGAVAVPAEVAGADYVLIEVCDTGTGMDPEVLARAFEPFFTTKPTGQGTGLGLSMAYGFVKQSGGEIFLDSEAGCGTRVRIFLRKSSAAAAAPDPVATAALVGGAETILVVEDEPDVRSTTVELLAALGYRVLQAEDAGCAVDVVNSGAHIDLLFSDVIMPGRVTSVELAQLVRRKLPDAQILFTSGYADPVLGHGGQLDPAISLLQKPYHADVLSARIRHLLQTRRAVADVASS